MSKVNELIKKLCPNGVEYRKLEDCCNILDSKRKPVSKGAREAGKYPYYGANGIQDYISDYIFDGKYILVGEDGSVQTTNGTPIVNWAEGKIWVNNHAHIIEEIDGVYLRYLYHYLQIVDVKDLIHGNIPKLNQGDFRNIKIAIPPLEVQEEIVKILDKFGELEKELEKELEERKNQYEFWREKLLNNRKYSVVSLGDYATFSQGIQVDPKDQKDYCDDGMVPFLRIVDFVKDDEPPRYIIKPDNKYIKKENEEMVMIRYGASAAGKVFINKYGAIANNMFKINLTTNEIDIKYLWHYLSQDKIYKSLNNTGGGSTMPAINFKMASSIQVVLPPKDEQNRIVKILDKFEELVNDTEVGLPAEVELRRKQYEYYRNKLLSFEELSFSE